MYGYFSDLTVGEFCILFLLLIVSWLQNLQYTFQILHPFFSQAFVTGNNPFYPLTCILSLLCWSPALIQSGCVMLKWQRRNFFIIFLLQLKHSWSAGGDINMSSPAGQTAALWLISLTLSNRCWDPAQSPWKQKPTPTNRWAAPWQWRKSLSRYIH